MTKKQVKEWVDCLQGNFEDKFDKENLKLSAHALRNSIGPTLLAHVISLTGAAATGPELFLVAVQQVNFMTVALVRTVCTKIVGLKLKSFPVKNVAKLGETISDLVKQIECSGEEPHDLLNLVAKPFTTGTQETFMTFAQGIHADVIAGKHDGDKVELISDMNQFCQTLVWAGDHEPAKGAKKDQAWQLCRG